MPLIIVTYANFSSISYWQLLTAFVVVVDIFNLILIFNILNKFKNNGADAGATQK